VKTKLIILHLLITLSAFYIIYRLEGMIFSLPNDELTLISEAQERKQEKHFDLSQTRTFTVSQHAFLARLKMKLGEEKLLAIFHVVPESTILELFHFIDVLPPKDQDYFAMLFSSLSTSNLKRLLQLLEQIGDRRINILVEQLLDLTSLQRSDLIGILTHMSLSHTVNLIDLMEQFQKHDLGLLIEIFLLTNDYDKAFLLLGSVPTEKFKDILTIVKKHPKSIKLLLALIKRVDANKLIDMLIKLDGKYATRLFTLLLNEGYSDSAITILLEISTAHVQRAIEMIEQDRSLLKDGYLLSERLKHRLGKKEGIDAIERSINTAARVDLASRRKGLTIISSDNIRDVATRRVLKQVDGYQEIYSGGVIKDMIDDHDTVKRPQRFIDILSGSDGIIHGAYRGDPRVSQERKLFRVQEIYGGNATKKQGVMDFYDRKPYVVPHRREDNFIILPPLELNKEGNN